MKFKKLIIYISFVRSSNNYISGDFHKDPLCIFVLKFFIHFKIIATKTFSSKRYTLIFSAVFNEIYLRELSNLRYFMTCSQCSTLDVT
jgi:hypothetical protein